MQKKLHFTSFPRSSRLHSNVDFKQMFRSPKEKIKKLSNEYLTLLVQNNVLNYPRLGIISNKREIKNATDRNRLKRIARECFRLKRQRLQNYDIVLLIYKNANKLERSEWRNIIEQQLEKLTGFSIK